METVDDHLEPSFILGPETSRPRKIAVVGGTHGNERGGVWVVEDLLGRPQDWQVPGLEVIGLLANPLAIQRNLRYLDRDLNRCFGPQLLHSRPDHEVWERRRALEIFEILGGGADRPDLVIDLHNTTANMGLTWILTSLDPWPLYLAAKAQESDPRVRILHTPESAQSNVFLPSLGSHEITLEIGPVPHGTHSHWAWLAARDQTRQALHRLASASDDFSPSQALQEMRFEFYQTLSVESYPLDVNGKPCALIHQEAQGRDYQPFAEGMALFVDPSRETTIPHRGPPMVPVFLGEAAYVESGIAFHATRRLHWTGTRGEPC